MTLGELADRLAALAEAEAEVTAAQQALGYGGSPSTMQGKREILECRQRCVADLRAEPLEVPRA